MVKRISVVLILVVLISPLGGCWNRKELNEKAVVLGTGVDLMADGRFRMTVQVALPGGFDGGTEQGNGVKEGAVWVLSAEGKTVSEAARNLAVKVPRDIYWSHCIILVIGEKMAQKGTRMVTNYFQRDREPRETMWFMVAKGEAKDILENYSILVKTSAQTAGYLSRMGKSYSVQLREFAEMLASNGMQPVAARVEIIEAGIIPLPGQENRSPALKQVGLSGVAVFKDDKLVGWLDNYETRGFLLLKSKTEQAGLFSVPSPGEPDKEVSIIIRRGNTKIVPKYDGESLWFNVLIRVEGDMIEQQSIEDLATPDKIKALEIELAEAVIQNVTATLEKAQTEYSADIFGFGDAFHRKYKKDWHQLKERWNEEFARAEINIAVEAHVRGIGILTKRASVPE